MTFDENVKEACDRLDKANNAILELLKQVKDSKNYIDDLKNFRFTIALGDYIDSIYQSSIENIVKLQMLSPEMSIGHSFKNSNLISVLDVKDLNIR